MQNSSMVQKPWMDGIFQYFPLNYYDQRLTFSSTGENIPQQILLLKHNSSSSIDNCW